LLSNIGSDLETERKIIHGQGNITSHGAQQSGPDHYDGWDGALAACEADAEDMTTIAAREGLSQSIILFTSQATFNRVAQELENATVNVSFGDLLMLTYSGQVGQLPTPGEHEAP
jgi:hypothetical protein